VFLALAIGYVAAVLENGGRKKLAYSVAAVAVGLFALFYPALSGILVASGYGDTVMKWLNTWPI
jgi:hypothetical protein